MLFFYGVKMHTNGNKLLSLQYSDGIIGKNIEIVPCAIREQRKAWHYNILKVT